MRVLFNVSQREKNRETTAASTNQPQGSLWGETDIAE